MTGPRPINPYVDVQIQYADSTWHSLNGEMRSLEFSRGSRPDLIDEMQVGTLSLEIVGTNWSPAINDEVRSKRGIRVRGQDHTGTWHTLWAGTLEMPVVNYSKTGTPITRFTGYDAIGRAARSLHSTKNLVQGSLQAQLNNAVLVKTGYRAFSTPGVVDTSGVSRTFTAVATSGDPTVLEMVERVRNNFIIGGKYPTAVWASRSDPAGLLARGSNDRYSLAPGLGPIPEAFSDQPGATIGGSINVQYTDIDVGMAAEWFKNSILFSYANGTNFGYIVDTSTTAEWDRNDIECISIGSGAAYTGFTLNLDRARAFFDTAPPPYRLMARSVTVNVFDYRRLLDRDPLFRLAGGVNLPGAAAAYGINAHFIVGETHRLTPTSWFVTYDLWNAEVRNPTPSASVVSVP